MKRLILALVLVIGGFLGLNHKQLSLITDGFDLLTNNSASAKSEVTFVKHVDGDTSKFKINGKVKK